MINNERGLFRAAVEHSWLQPEKGRAEEEGVTLYLFPNDFVLLLRRIRFDATTKIPNDAVQAWFL